MSLASVGGTITTVVGLGVTLGALGLALEFVDRSADRASRSVSGKKLPKRKPLFDLNLPPKRSTFQRGTRNINSVFDPFPANRKGSRRRSNGGDFF